jgi:hypothetical protein
MIRQREYEHLSERRSTFERKQPDQLTILSGPSENSGSQACGTRRLDELLQPAMKKA